MILSLQSQGMLFFITILLGGILALVYDCLRIFRRVIVHQRLWIQLEDGLFWVGAVFFAFGVMLKTNHGEIRFFALFGMLGGMLLYFLTLSPLVMAVSNGVIFVVKKVIILFLTIVLTPFRLVYLVFRQPLEHFQFFCAKKKKKVLHSCKFYVKIRYLHLSRDWRMARQKRSKGGEAFHAGQEESKRDES